MVCGAVLELVKVLETTPNVLADPRVGAVAAKTGADIERSTANAALAGMAKGFRSMLHLHLITQGGGLEAQPAPLCQLGQVEQTNPKAVDRRRVG